MNTKMLKMRSGLRPHFIQILLKGTLNQVDINSLLKEKQHKHKSVLSKNIFLCYKSKVHEKQTGIGKLLKHTYANKK